MKSDNPFDLSVHLQHRPSSVWVTEIVNTEDSHGNETVVHSSKRNCISNIEVGINSLVEQIRENPVPGQNITRYGIEVIVLGDSDVVKGVVEVNGSPYVTWTSQKLTVDLY